MAHPTHIGIPLALALLPALVPVAAAPAADSGFCVEARDGALWIDCEREQVGITRRTAVLCRRTPASVLIEVTDIDHELPPGSGDCPAPGASRAGPGKDGIPRTDGEEAGAGGGVTAGATPGVPAAKVSAGGTPALLESTHGH